MPNVKCQLSNVKCRLSGVKCQVSNVRCRSGFALIATTIITALLLVAGSYFVSTSVSDIRIARSHAETIRAYYLSEGSSALMLNQLQTNATLTNAFVAGTLTQANSTVIRSNIFSQGDTTSTYAISSARGEATVFTTAITPLGDTTVTRRITTKISRALGNAIEDYSTFVGGNDKDLELKLSATFSGGIIFSNDDIKIQNGATITAQGGIRAHDKIEVAAGSTLNLSGSRKEGQDRIDMPAVDFDSSAPNSWRSRATAVMTPSQFNALPSGSSLTGIIFVNGSPAHLHKDLTVTGVLVINGSFEIEQPSHLRILSPGGNQPSGLLARNSIEIENSTYVEGLVYASNYLEIEYDDDDTAGTLDVTVKGGIMGQQVVLSRDKPGPVAISITHDKNLISPVLSDDVTDSPLIDIGHWEEQY